MPKTGFLVKVKARNKEYFYLRKTARLEEDKSLKRDWNIFSFGQRNKALESLMEWKEDINKFPIKLQKMGYDREDILNWIEQIKNK